MDDVLPEGVDYRATAGEWDAERKSYWLYFTDEHGQERCMIVPEDFIAGAGLR
jgi:hypothetical protein